MKPIVLVLAGTLAAVSTPALAVTIFTTDLSGANEVPPNASPGTGSAVVTLSDDQLSLEVSVDWEGLTAATVAGHIHCCAPSDGTAGVAVGFDGLASVVSGSYFRLFDLTDIAVFNPDFLAANGGTADGARDALLDGMFAELSYVNLHTPNFPPGEIRGQLVETAAVPEPAIGGLMLLGLGLLAAARRKG